MLEEVLARAGTLAGTPGQDYVERRGIPVVTAGMCGAGYAADFGGRPAVIVGLYNQFDELRSVHGRYLHVLRGQDKMHTIGPGGGVISVLSGRMADPLIVVEGLFDAMSLAVCGYGCIATIGRWVPWLPDFAAGRRVWIAFDNGKAGDAAAGQLAAAMSQSEVRRLRPPGRSKDWNTALVKQGRAAVGRWLKQVTP